MSTRSNIDFYEHKPDGGTPFVARLYHHSDGYPSWRMKNIKAMRDLANKGYDASGGYGYRVNEPDMYDLAAFYVLANKDGPGDVYIDSGPLHEDIEYYYQIWPEDNVIMVRINNIHSPDETETGTLAALHSKHVREG